MNNYFYKMQSNYPKGVCSQMCPEEEIMKREGEGLLHILEILPNQKNCRTPKADRYRVVKEFRRSAAGRSSQTVKDLRTIEALLETINYLLHDVITVDYLQFTIIYDYIMNRLRAVRQDMVIQNLPRYNCISILQPIIKFYAYSAYKLCEKDISHFDPVMNKNHLQECLKRLLCLYDETDEFASKISEMGDIVQFRNDLLYADCRPFMESLYLLVNLGDTIAINRAVQLSAVWKGPLVNKCIQMSLECWQGNYVRVCKQIFQLPPLLAATAALQLPSIRKQAFIRMSSAYSSRNVTFPSAVIQSILLYNTVEEVFNDCDYYAIPISNGDVAFSKTSIHSDKKEPAPTHHMFIDELLSKQSIPTLLLETNEYLEFFCAK